MSRRFRCSNRKTSRNSSCCFRKGSFLSLNSYPGGTPWWDLGLSCLAAQVLPTKRFAEIQGFRAKTFRRLAESKKVPWLPNVEWQILRRSIEGFVEVPGDFKKTGWFRWWRGWGDHCQKLYADVHFKPKPKGFCNDMQCLSAIVWKHDTHQLMNCEHMMIHPLKYLLYISVRFCWRPILHPLVAQKMLRWYGASNCGRCDQTLKRLR